ncbi:MAG: PAS domain S-box protein [Proteobacteria bacterium]|nr:PAS domain S-box protein [Pseudomonadota bacterium]
MLKTIHAEERFVTVAMLGLLVVALFVVSRYDYLLFHGLMEMVSVVICASIFFLTVHARRHLENAALRLLGVAFLSISLLNLLHTLAYKGMGVFPGYDANLPTQLWVALRQMSAVTFLLAALLLGRKVRLDIAAGAYAVLTAALIWAVFTGNFPDCFVEGRGLTPFKIRTEFAAMLMLAWAGVLFYRRREYFDSTVVPLLLSSITLSALAGVAFSVYVGVYDLSNFTGHMLLLFSALCLHRAVFVTGVSTPYALISRKLREAEAQFRGIVENSAEGLFQMDREGRILAANPAFARVLGYGDAALALGQPLSRHFPGGPQEFRQVVEPALEGSKVLQHELAAQRLDGMRVWLSLSVLPAQGEEAQRLNGSLRDISTQVQMENLRQDVERILQHELRSPLSGILGLGRVLSEDTTLPPTVRDMGGMIADTGWRLLRMTDESMALRRLEEGTYIPELGPVELLEVLERVRMWHATLSGRKALEVRLLLDGEATQAGSSCLVRADEHLLEHALSNLLKNALEATPKGTTVTVRVDSPHEGAVSGHAAQFWQGDPAKAVHVVIHNLGEVPKDVRGRFFERYATSGKTAGTGLGTHIARLAVLAQGGGIAFTSSASEGTTLHVILPGAERKVPVAP